MTNPDADSMAELIEDCTAIPPALRSGHQELPLPRTAPAWSVNDTCQAQVNDLDEYV